MNWPLTGVLAAIAIVIGIVLLVWYAVRRGLVHGDLPDTITVVEVPVAAPPPAAEPAHTSRTVGMLGAAILVVGLALGVVTAVGGWGGGATGGGCAQSWNACPQTTPPAASAKP